MAIDLSGNISRFEAGDLRMFGYIDTVSIPSCIQFNIYDVNGNVLAPTAVESGVTVSASGATPGYFYIFRQLPSSRGFYTTEWMVYGSGTAQSSLFTRQREVFEVYKTEPVSIYSYGNKNTVMRVSRQLVGRGDLTEYDIAPHMLAAYDFINAKLGTVPALTVPFSPATNYIAQGEEILAVYTLFGTYGASEKSEIPPSFQTLYDNFLKYMDAVIAGEITVDGTIINAGRVTSFTGGIDGGLPTFGRRDFQYQIVDWNILEAEWGSDGWPDCIR